MGWGWLAVLVWVFGVLYGDGAAGWGGLGFPGVWGFGWFCGCLISVVFGWVVGFGVFAGFDDFVWGWYNMPLGWISEWVGFLWVGMDVFGLGVWTCMVGAVGWGGIGFPWSLEVWMVFLRVFDFGCFWMGCLCLGFTSLRFCAVVCGIVCRCGLEFWDRCFC